MSNANHWRMVIALVLGLSIFLILYTRSRDADDTIYFENMALLRHVQQLDAQRDVEVLRLTMGGNINYDSLVSPTIEIEALVEQLAGVAVQQHAGHVDQSKLQTSVQTLHREVEGKGQLIERFKSHNSRLRNSLTFLPIAADNFRSRAIDDIADRQLEREVRRGVSEVLLAVLLYTRSGSNDRLAEVNEGLTVLAANQHRLPDALVRRLIIFRSHVALVLREQAIVNDLLKNIADVPTTAHLEQIGVLFDDEWRTTSIRAAQYRGYLLVLSVALAILLVYAGSRLFRAHGALNLINRQLQEANETLEQRVRERTDELGSSYAMLHATLESTADAVLAIRNNKIYYNKLYLEMWNLTEQQLTDSGYWQRVAWNAEQTTDPDGYVATIKQRGLCPEQEAFDTIELKDGRFIERYTKPQRVDGRAVGVVINYRDITRRKHNEAELEKIHRQLLQSSRQAGMAEVATGVLHNVGNVLNSVNVSTNLLADSIKQSKIPSLMRAAALLREQQGNLGQFMENDPRGKHLVEFFSHLAEHLRAEQQAMIGEVETLRSSIDHIKEIVAMQQGYAKISGVSESLNVIELVEDTLRMSDTALQRHGVTVVREFEMVPSINADKHKILQILVNLVTNAKRACSESTVVDKRITIRVGSDAGVVRIAVSDNGVGIPAENLTRIFGHGFTTRKDGHGFGLHSGALAARELGGALSVHSDGAGLGATFVLELPLQQVELAYGT